MENISGHILEAAHTIQTVPKHLWMRYFKTPLEKVNKKLTSTVTKMWFFLDLVCFLRLKAYQ